MAKFRWFQTVSFDNPLEAINYLEKKDNISLCSLVITDYKMPQISGIDLIKKIQKKDMNYKIKNAY
jgi:YesN/AraC family two-component response regulator